jgi:serine/threonine protein kinase
MVAELERIDKCKVLEETGHGGLAVVYRAHNTSLDRIVALRVLHLQLTVDPKSIERLKGEACITAVLRDPHMVTIYEVDETDRLTPYRHGVSL